MFPTRLRTSCYRRMLLMVTVFVLGFDVVEPTSIRENGSLIITSILDQPYLMIRHTDEGAKYEGFCADLIASIAEIAGFNYTINLVKDGRYGVKQPDGSWNGMIGEVIRNEADLAVAPLTITSERERVVDFTKPFMTVGISLMLKRITKAPQTYLTFLLPFRPGVWLALLAACPVVGLLMFAIARYSPAEKLRNTDNKGAANKNDDIPFSLANSLWYSVRTMLLQGSNSDPRSISGRALSAIWWLFVIIILAFYTAQLVVLTIYSDKYTQLYPVSSAEDLSKQTIIKYGVIQGGSTQEFFRRSTNPVYEQMWQTMNADPSVFVRSTAEGIQKVRESNGKYAFFLESAVNDYISQKMPCDTVRVGPNLNRNGYGIAMQAGSRLGARINLALLELLERDIIEKLQKKWWYEKSECQATSPVLDSTAQQVRPVQASLDLADVAGVFIMLLIGIVLALIIALVEFLFARAKAGKKSETRKTGESQSKEENV